MGGGYIFYLKSVSPEVRMQPNIVFINQRGNYFSLQLIFRQIINQVCNKQQNKDNCSKHGFKKSIFCAPFLRKQQGDVSIKKRKQTKKRNTQHIRSRKAYIRRGKRAEDSSSAEAEGSQCRGRERRGSGKGESRR